MRSRSFAFAGAILASVTLLLSACSGGVPGNGGFVPFGTVWTSKQITTAEMGRWQYTGSFTTENELWFFVSERGESVLYRTNDGDNFERTVTGEGRILGFAAGPKSIIGVGYLDQKPIIHRSQDGGKSWRSERPSGIPTPKNSEQYLESVTYHDGAFFALATIKAADWRMVLYRSSDGLDWSKVTEYRGDGYALSGHSILSDGEQLVVLGEEHLCSDPHINSSAGGWYLTSSTHLFRVYQGTNPAALALQNPAVHPLVSEPASYDCSLSVPELSKKYGSHEVLGAKVIDGVVTMLGRKLGEGSSGLELAELVGGQWMLSSNEMLTEADRPLVELYDAGGQPGVVFADHEAGIMRFLERENDKWQVTPTAHRLFFGSYHPPAVFKGEQYMVSFIAADRLAEFRAGNEVEISVWKNQGMAPADFGRCPADTKSCEHFIAAQQQGFPALAGASFDGYTLDLAVLNDADLTGASFVSARLFAASTNEETLLHRADFTNAELGRALLRNADGAIFAGAKAQMSEITFIDEPPVLVGADLTGASVAPDPFAFSKGPWEISLENTVLTRATVRGGFAEGQELIVTSLRGAIVKDASFSNVDLSNADVTGVDLSGARFDADSVCPGGAAPQSGKCQ